jgi:hypothetical protein
VRKCRQQIVSFFFGAIILLPLLAIGILQLGQAYIRSTREERLETEKQVQVVVPVKDLVWEEEEKELWVGDRMFDVASYTIGNGNYYLKGVFDDDETEVAGSLLHLLLSKDGSTLLQFILLLQAYTFSILAFNCAWRLWPSRQWSLLSLQSYASPQLLVLGPPPKW